MVKSMSPKLHSVLLLKRIGINPALHVTPLRRRPASNAEGTQSRPSPTFMMTDHAIPYVMIRQNR
jgi:hypothetical protein